VGVEELWWGEGGVRVWGVNEVWGIGGGEGGVGDGRLRNARWQRAAADGGRPTRCR
jgi:hypothetical protein